MTLANLGTPRCFEDPIPETKPEFERQLTLLSRLRKKAREAGVRIRDGFDCLRDYESRALLLSGSELHSGEELRTHYVGTGDNFAFLVGMLYRDYDVVDECRGLGPLQVRSWPGASSDAADLSIIDVSWPYDRWLVRADHLVLPAYVEQVKFLPDSWQEVQQGFSRNLKKSSLRLVRKHGLSARFVHSDSAVESFYHTMYVPLIVERFGSSAYIEPEDRVRRWARQGGLIEILRHDQVVYAGLVVLGDRVLSLILSGCPEDRSQMQTGAPGALYYYTIVYAFELGCDLVWFGQSRPLMEDGVFATKMRWGSVVMESGETMGDILVSLEKLSPGVRSLLSNHCLVTRQDGKLITKTLYDGRLEASALTELADRCFCEGIDMAKILCTGGVAEEARELIREQGMPLSAVDLETSDQPAREFCRR